MELLPADIKRHIIKFMDCEQQKITKMTNPELSPYVNCVNLRTKAKIFNISNDFYFNKYSKKPYISIQTFEIAQDYINYCKDYVVNHQFKNIIRADIVICLVNRRYYPNVEFIYDGKDYLYINNKCIPNIQFTLTDYWPNKYKLI